MLLSQKAMIYWSNAHTFGTFSGLDTIGFSTDVKRAEGIPSDNQKGYDWGQGTCINKSHVEQRMKLAKMEQKKKKTQQPLAGSNPVFLFFSHCTR